MEKKVSFLKTIKAMQLIFNYLSFLFINLNIKLLI